MTDPAGTLKRYFTDQEVAAGFGVSRRTLARWRDRRVISFLQLPAGFGPGLKVLYLARHLVEFEKRITQDAKRERGRPRKLAALIQLFTTLLEVW